MDFQERFHKSQDEVKALVDKALAAGLQTDVDFYEVFQAACDYEKRKLKLDGKKFLETNRKRKSLRRRC